MRRKRFFDDDLFGDFDRMHDMIEEMMSDTLKDFEGARFDHGGKPLVYGFSFKVGENGKPVVNEFGNVPRQGRKSVSDEREPLVDVIDEKDYVKVIAELPGVEEKEVKLSVKEKALSIHVHNPDRRYAKDVELPAKVSKQVNTSFKNGILEVVLKKV